MIHMEFSHIWDANGWNQAVVLCGGSAFIGEVTNFDFSPKDGGLEVSLRDVESVPMEDANFSNDDETGEEDEPDDDAYTGYAPTEDAYARYVSDTTDDGEPKEPPAKSTD